MRLPPLPDPPRPASRPPFPVIAVVAPMVGAVVIGLVLGSPFLLLFAALGPIVAVASFFDSRRNARNHQRHERERFERECSLFEHAIRQAHDVERREANHRHPLGAHPRESALRDGSVRIGSAPAPSAVAPDLVRPIGDSEADERLSRMLALAQRNSELPALIARGPIVLEGHGLVADGLARRLSREPGVTLYRRNTRDITSALPVPPDRATVITVQSVTSVEVCENGGERRRVRPEFISARQADALQIDSDAAATVPDTVSWKSLQNSEMPSTRATGVPIGIGEGGVVSIDLISSGPHALVGGTTGSGKSELLRALALGWAAAHSPDSAQMLFVDFKGGATFAGLTELPHAVGLVTDLDPIVAERALRALRAELHHRERTLAAAGIRDLRDNPEILPRLLVLVDEFATLATTFPELHGAFADVAARGRSLGVHLVLCTQHPASIVRDVVAANCPLRLSFRVTEAASAGMAGDRARELMNAPPGRAVLVDDRGTHLLQVAVVVDDDIAHVRELWREHRQAARTWCDPLPAVVRPHELPDGERSPRSQAISEIPFGMADDPERRRHVTAVWKPPSDGALAVMGASMSGRTTMLATLAHGIPAHAQVIVLPESLPDAWAVLERVVDGSPTPTLLMCDRLDELLARSTDRASEVLARWDAAVRSVRSRGGAAVASLAAASAASSLVNGRFESRLLLRCSDADEHSVAGGPRGLFERSAPPGRGWWNDLQVQVVHSDQPMPTAECLPVLQWQPAGNADAVVITPWADEVVDRIRLVAQDHRLVRDLSTIDPLSLGPAPGTRGGGEARAPRLIIAGPSEWQAAWSLLSAARMSVPVALMGVNAAEVRGLLGIRDALPPIDSQRGECWLAEPAQPVIRARWSLVADATR